MPKVGDGTGRSGGGGEHDGLTWRDDSPNSGTDKYAPAYQKGQGTEFDKGNRTTPPPKG